MAPRRAPVDSKVAHMLSHMCMKETGPEAAARWLSGWRPLDAVLRADAQAQLGGPAVDADSTGADPLLDLATRAEAGAGQYFLQALCHG